MFNKFAMVIMGLMLTVSSVGCCCLHGGGGYGAGYGMRQGCPPCNSCPPAGGGYYQQQGAFYQGMDASQTAFAPTGLSQTAFVPNQSAYTATSTALAPIQGAPIYNTAILPASTLPLY